MFKCNLLACPDAEQTFSLFDKKGDGQVSTKDLGSVFKSLGLTVDAQKLKDWSDEMDEDGESVPLLQVTA